MTRELNKLTPSVSPVADVVSSDTTSTESGTGLTLLPDQVIVFVIRADIHIV